MSKKAIWEKRQNGKREMAKGTSVDLSSVAKRALSTYIDRIHV